MGTLTPDPNEAIEEKLNNMATLFCKHALPDYMWDGIRLYMAHGVKPGQFMCAVLCNDLTAAVAHADISNKAALATWVDFFFQELPVAAWGHPERVEKWMTDGGYYGYLKNREKKSG
jgi:hypothetical protein